MGAKLKPKKPKYMARIFGQKIRTPWKQGEREEEKEREKEGGGKKKRKKRMFKMAPNKVLHSQRAHSSQAAVGRLVRSVRAAWAPLYGRPAEIPLYGQIFGLLLTLHPCEV